MPRYLVEVSEPQVTAAKRIDRSVKTFGSHFATHADWHHQDGMSTGTMIVEAADRWRALGIIPPAMRPDAQVFQLEAAATGGRPHAPPAHAAQPTAMAA